jgi:nicotinate-nucleotide adenylyltransferase
MKTLIYGGSFDPIHYGHLITAMEVAEKGEYDRIVFVPSALSTHKNGKTSLGHRLHMCQKAVEDIPAFVVSDIEGEMAKQGIPSYSANVAVALSELGYADGNNKIHWLIGSDNVGKVASWRNQTVLKALVHFIVVRRDGQFYDRSLFETNGLSYEGYATTGMGISSSLVRSRVEAGRSVAFYVPPAIDSYIKVTKLYLNKLEWARP